MNYGLTDIQRNLDNSSQSGIKNAASLERQREQDSMAIDQADDASKKSSIGQGVGLGASIGTSVAPGIGTAVGAVAGGIFGYLSYEFI